MKITALTGGVGGAKLVDGLAQVVPPRDLTIVVNTGDDFTHWGLPICPDLDTVMYTLAGLAHPEQGWGLADETFHAFAMMERYGAPLWFRLGDRDLGTHLRRAELLASGATLTACTETLCRALRVAPRVLPMADAARPTMIDTPEGTLTFQEWLVGRRGVPRVTRVWSRGEPRATGEVLDAIAGADVVVIGPSNPYVSIDPILATGGVRAAVAAARRVIAVSPIVAGKAVKGPLAGMIESLAGRAPSAAAIADHYAGLIHRFVVERGDEAGIDLPTFRTQTIMRDRADRARLATEVLAFAEGRP